MENTYMTDVSLPLDFDEERNLLDAVYFIKENAKSEETFLQALNTLVKHKNVGNNQLAEMTGIDKGIISRYLSGERQISRKHLCLICIALRLMTSQQKYLFDLLKEPMPCSIGKPDMQELIIKHCMDGCYYNLKYTVDYYYKLLNRAEKIKADVFFQTGWWRVMSRFFYQHFGDDVPKNIQVECNKMLRHEQYLEERDAEFMAQLTNFDKVLEAIPDPASLPINEIAEENRRRKEARLEFLPDALEMLRNDYPEGYELIQDYYFGKKKVPFRHLAKKYGMTIAVIKYRLSLRTKMTVENCATI